VTNAQPWGWIIIDKDSDMTSMSVTRQIKKKTGLKIGHAGTLDPLATGILPLALGQTTHLIPEIMSFKKSYAFTVQWGQSTDTDDSLGKIIETTSVRPSEKNIQKALFAFRGEISQTPPFFSAVKIKGRPAYHAARKGEKIFLKSRKIFIDELQLIEHNKHQSKFHVCCGSGTYVRSLARDIARQTGTLGHITQLRRTSVGPFQRGSKIQDLLKNHNHWKAHLLPPQSILFKMPYCYLCQEDVVRLWQGQKIHVKETYPLFTKGRIVCYNSEMVLVAIGFFDKGEISPVRCFIRKNGKH
jgi:tRNA pseudouridine55 synthase